MIKVLANAKLRDKQLESLRQISPELDIVRTVEPEEVKRQYRDADILFTFHLPAPLEEAHRLRWIQLVSAGAEHLYDAGIQDRPDILVTTASGIHRTAIAEYSLWAMITMARRMAPVLRESDRRQWQPRRAREYYGEELRGKTLGILGLGSIGREVASVARCLGMQVLGLRRSPGAGGGGESIDELFGPEGIEPLLSRSDFVLVALPLTSETRGLVGEREFRAMKPTAFLINAARGAIIDEKALATALREGWIAGATLDVFVEEPLPADSEMWDLPNLIITPHMAGGTLPYLDRATEIFRENLRRYLAGEDMINLLDRRKGY